MAQILLSVPLSLKSSYNVTDLPVLQSVGHLLSLNILFLTATFNRFQIAAVVIDAVNL